jgi:protein-tyrosine kinase
MGFFYQAMKRATGVEVEPEKQAAEQAVASAATATAVAPSPTATVLAATLPRTSSARSFEVPHPVQNLVAFLSPPILDANIVAMEQCRLLRTRLRDTLQARKAKSLLITSATPNEGKTLMAVNLAYALSQLEGMKVLLVDADLRKPSVSEFLKMPVTTGLHTFLQQQVSFDDVCWKLTPSLSVVPAATLHGDSAEALHSKRMQEFLHTASQEFNVVLVDGPPLFPIVDAQVLAPLVDAAVLIVRAHQTPFDMARQATDVLKSKFIGAILNGVEHMPHHAYYGSYYGTKKKK